MNKHFLNTPGIYKFGSKWVGYLPLSVSYGLARIFADISYIYYRSAAKNSATNLRQAFPLASGKEIHHMARRSFRNYATYLVDFVRFTTMTKEEIIKQIFHYQGEDNLERARELGKGIILLTAHLGNWELGGFFFGSYGLKTNVVTLPDQDPEIDGMRGWYRQRFDVKTVTIGNSPLASLELVNALNRGELIAMLIDRYNDKVECVYEKFFGKEAPFPRGPFLLSKITGAPIIVAFVVKEGERYIGIIEGPLTVSQEQKEGETLKKVVNLLEKYIMMYPEQWYNFVPLW